MRGPLCFPRVDRRSRAGCGGDTYRRRTGYDERYPLSIRVGADALHRPAGSDNRACGQIPTVPVRKVSGRCGHRPLRERRDFSFNRARPDALGVPSTPGPAGPPSPSRRGQGSRWERGCARSDTLPPHTRQGLWPCHPLPGEGRGFSPPSRLRRATSLYAREAFAQKPQSFRAISSAISL